MDRASPESKSHRAYGRRHGVTASSVRHGAAAYVAQAESVCRVQCAASFDATLRLTVLSPTAARMAAAVP